MGMDTSDTSTTRHGTQRYGDILTAIFSNADEIQACKEAFVKIEHHVHHAIITGGLATKPYCVLNGLRIPRIHLNDIDLVVDAESHISETLTDEFYIAHYHPTRGNGKMLMQLADKDTSCRIDIFTSVSPLVSARATPMSFGHRQVKLLSPEDVAAKLLSTLYRVLYDKSVDPKYYQDFQLLCDIVDDDKLKTVWLDYKKAHSSSNVDEVIKEIRTTLERKPELLRENHYETNVKKVCPWCQDSPIFPVAEKMTIYEMWGFI
jgi:hypothetical protein